MESIRDMEMQPLPQSQHVPLPTPETSSATYPQPFRAKLASTIGPYSPEAINEMSPLLSGELDEDIGDTLVAEEREQSGGTILGIHNLAIVAPQFFVAIVAALIFKLLGRSDPNDGGGAEGGLRGTNDVVWVLRFGALMSLIGAIVSRRVLVTPSETAYIQLLKAQLKDGEDEQE
jgi:solute carrier family 45 protein 1/2/4